MNLRCRQFCADPLVFKAAVESCASRVQRGLRGEDYNKGEHQRLACALRALVLEEGKEWSTMTRTKHERVLEIIDECAPGSRVVVFCSWRLELRSYAASLRTRLAVMVLCLHSRMSSQAVADTVAAFEDADDDLTARRVLLVSVCTGGMGLNLQAADHVILTCPLGTSFAEAQVIARSVGRKGTLSVDLRPPQRITRLVLCNTIEDK